MAVCAFFGHRDCPDIVRPLLYQCLEEMIFLRGVNLFCVGNQGKFDGLVCQTLRELTYKFLPVRYGVVLACLSRGGEKPSDTMLPEGIEKVPPQFAISRRSNWMLEQADYIVCYITHHGGGAATGLDGGFDL